MRASEAILQFLVNLSAAVAHILGSEGERPVSAWAWRFGSRTLQYAVLAAIIALPVWFAAGRFITYGELWTLLWLGCWAAQGLLVARRWHGAYKRARGA